MGTRFHVRIGDEECVCELLEDKAPNVCAIFRRALPLQSFATHAKFAEEELIVMLPIWPESENFLPEGYSEGDVCFSIAKPTLALFYGHVTPFGPSGVFARLVEGQEAMRRAARVVLEKGSLPATIFLEGGAQEGQAPLIPAVETPLTSRVRTFLESVWGQEPGDVQALRSFTRPVMGHFPVVFHACSDLYWTGENLQVCVRMARQGDLALPEVNRMTGAFLERARSRLAMWEMKDTVALLAESVSYFTSGGPATIDEYLSITQDLLLTVERIWNWIDASLPWSKLDRALSPQALARLQAEPSGVDR